MNFRETPLSGAFIVEPERHEDSRGFFARTFCHDEMTEHGLESVFVQCNTSFNRSRGTLRGLHYQADPHGEAKLIRCTAGRAWDVMVDIRPGSRSYGKWLGVELSAVTGRMVYLPEGFAHGFQTLEDDTELFYQMSRPYFADAAQGLRWDDPAFAIEWPIPDPIMSDRDRAFDLLPPFGAIARERLRLAG